MVHIYKCSTQIDTHVVCITARHANFLISRSLHIAVLMIIFYCSVGLIVRGHS